MQDVSIYGFEAALRVMTYHSRTRNSAFLSSVDLYSLILALCRIISYLENFSFLSTTSYNYIW